MSCRVMLAWAGFASRAPCKRALLRASAGHSPPAAGWTFLPSLDLRDFHVGIHGAPLCLGEHAQLGANAYVRLRRVHAGILSPGNLCARGAVRAPATSRVGFIGHDGDVPSRGGAGGAHATRRGGLASMSWFATECSPSPAPLGMGARA